LAGVKRLVFALRLGAIGRLVEAETLVQDTGMTR
jgi:hypothetical protein